MRIHKLAVPAVLLAVAVVVLFALSRRDGWAYAEPAAGAPAAPAAPAEQAGVAPGDAVTVYLRGDASGLAYSDRVTSTHNFVSRTGSLVSIDADWVVLENNGVHHFIPPGSIAVVEVRAKK